MIFVVLTQVATQSSLLTILGEDFSVYDAIAMADPLHQIEQGIFGKHMWPKIKDLLNRQGPAILDQRRVCSDNFSRRPTLKFCYKILRYPVLSRPKTLPKRCHELEYINCILKQLAPLLEDLLDDSYKKATLRAVRRLACVHLLTRLTTHTDDTLGLLRVDIASFGEAWEDFSSSSFVEGSKLNVSTHFPKLHALSHTPRMIERKSTVDNYETGLGEALHPQSKIDFTHTNHRPGF
ncbi:hypothetical protein FRC09_015590 [Ceratobasidium sp. 395]|nr:hypothetical protein FRC09_015590 [Ceratobasidium sp. 395]